VRNSPEPVTRTPPDLATEQIERLKQIFPECVTEGQVDFDQLRATLGDADALAGEDTYSFTWAGKQEAFRAIQAPSAASLAPAPEESVNWDETQHLFIAGENLEVLKLLYKSYFGRIKMIYIDPPYNTGNDFIYRDDYRQPRRAYLEKTGQIDAGQPAHQQPGDEWALPFRLAQHDVSPPLSSPPVSARGWCDLCEY